MGKYSFDVVIFDLDGVITKTAIVHAHAWKVAFDEYLRLRESRDGEAFREFTNDGDYLSFVDGKPRYEGVRSFLESRGINIHFGDSRDSEDKETICGIGNKKNAMFLKVLEQEGVEVYDSSIVLIKKLRAEGIRVGVASSSKSCKYILESAGIEDLFETRVDGVVSVELGLKGKPQGDIFVTATRNLGGTPCRAAIVEDALSGVQAARNGAFGFVIGLARKNNTDELMKGGADVVVSDLSEITIDDIEQWFHRTPRVLDEAWNKKGEEQGRGNIKINPVYNSCGRELFCSGKKIAFFLDYDGTLSPIVQRPELAVISRQMRETIKQLAQKYTVSIVSGRMRENVQKLVGIDNIFYAGSHGFDIAGPRVSMVHKQAQVAIPLVAEMVNKFKESIGSIEGVLIEDKKFSAAVHYRLVKEKHFGRIKDKVEEVTAAYKGFHLMRGKKVFEILPDIDWDKGKAVQWIMGALKISWEDVLVVYIGDDTTDENVFRFIRGRGVGILVSRDSKESAADFRVASTNEVREFLEKIIRAS